VKVSFLARDRERTVPMYIPDTYQNYRDEKLNQKKFTLTITRQERCFHCIEFCFLIIQFQFFIFNLFRIRLYRPGNEMVTHNIQRYTTQCNGQETTCNDLITAKNALTN
jgi:hypothetical protein